MITWMTYRTSVSLTRACSAACCAACGMGSRSCWTHRWVTSLVYVASRAAVYYCRQRMGRCLPACSGWHWPHWCQGRHRCHMTPPPPRCSSHLLPPPPPHLPPPHLPPPHLPTHLLPLPPHLMISAAPVCYVTQTLHDLLVIATTWICHRPGNTTSEPIQETHHQIITTLPQQLLKLGWSPFQSEPSLEQNPGTPSVSITSILRLNNAMAPSWRNIDPIKSRDVTITPVPPQNVIKPWCHLDVIMISSLHYLKYHISSKTTVPLCTNKGHQLIKSH